MNKKGEIIMLLRVAENFSFYLPVYLPFIFALLSIIAGIASSKINLSLSELLKVHGDMTLGLFSFVTWAIVTYMQTKVVALNSDYYIEFSHILFLLLINFGLLLLSIIAIRHDWENSKFNCYLRCKSENVSKWVNFAVLFFSIFCAFLPLMLIKPIVKPQEVKNGYVVVLPYQDYSLISHIGASKWSSNKLCDIQNIIADDENSAISNAIDLFKKSAKSQAMIPSLKKNSNTSENSVEINHDQIIVHK